MVSKKDSNKARLQRHKRVRAKISGTAERPASGRIPFRKEHLCTGY